MTIEEHIVSLSKRLDRLETGGKPMIALSDAETQSQAYNPPHTFDFTHVFPNSVEQNPYGSFYYTVYIDNKRFPDEIGDLPDVDIAYVIRFIQRGDRLASNTNESNARVTVQHVNSVYTPTSIKVEARWVYLTSSASQ